VISEHAQITNLGNEIFTTISLTQIVILHHMESGLDGVAIYRDNYQRSLFSPKKWREATSRFIPVPKRLLILNHIQRL